MSLGKHETPVRKLKSSEARKVTVPLHNRDVRTRKFYQALLRRSDEARKYPESLIPVEDIS